MGKGSVNRAESQRYNVKRIDRFILHDLLKVFKKCEIAFYIEDRRPYDSVLPSVRMRCHDILNFLEQEGMNIEIYKPYKKYKVVIFTKVRGDKAVSLARKLHAEGTIVISDNYCEYLTDETRADDWERRNILDILKVSDYAFVYSKTQYEQFSKYHNKVMVMEECVHESYFEKQIAYTEQTEVTLLYSGYAHNALYVKEIADVIVRLQEEYGCHLLFLCEKDPEFTEFCYTYEKYDQNRITEQLRKGDIMIAPRTMKGIEKMAHTLSKVAGPMAMGLPAVASPIPSYLGTPVVICYDNEEWYKALKKLICDTAYRRALGEKSREYIYSNYSRQVIGRQYKEFLKRLIEE